MDQTKEEFIVWIRTAISNKRSVPYEELYSFLVACFVRADVEKNGRVTVVNFDTLIEEAAAMPRKYGFAPKTTEMYPNDSARREGRSKLFKQIDVQKTGYITLEEWIQYALSHIVGKLVKLPKDYLNGAPDVTKQEFITYIKKAVKPGTPEHYELYYFLLQTFQAGDVKRTGEIDPIAFDRMIEAAAAAPRRYGLAPKSSDMFKTDWERLSKRKEYFDTMDTNRSGTITFDEWLAYAMKHIMEKASKV